MPKIVYKRAAKKHIDRAENSLTDKDGEDKFPIVYARRSGDIANEIGRHEREKCPCGDEYDAEWLFEAAFDAADELRFVVFEIFPNAERFGAEIYEA